MAKRLLVIAVLTCIVTALAAPSPPPPPTPTKSAHEEQQASDRVNANRDLLKQVTVLLKRQNEYAERQRKKDSDKAASDWWLVYFTGALTFVGIVQLIAMFKQASSMRRSLAETKRGRSIKKGTGPCRAWQLCSKVFSRLERLFSSSVNALGAYVSGSSGRIWEPTKAATVQ
jgi:hypothetical protein